MAGETAKTEAICLRIAPWSLTSHVVTWLTPTGRISTSVKGAVRPKSAFLGQYDLNYLCEIVYYLGARGDLHALRECAPVELHDALRGDYRALLVAEHFRTIAGSLAPFGADAAEWFDLLKDALRRLHGHRTLLAELLRFELAALRLSGLAPEVEAESGGFLLRGERRLPVSNDVARCIKDPTREKNIQTLRDAARAIGVFYAFHLDGTPETRRAILQTVTTKEEGNTDG